MTTFNSPLFRPRPNTLLSLWDFAHYIPYNIFSLMGLSYARCVRTESTTNCQIPYAEYTHQEPGYPSRNTLLHRIAEAEQRMADVLGYYPGPKCIQGEEHTLKHWNQQIRLKWDKVVTTGKCEYHRLDEGIARSREFIDAREDTIMPGASNPFYEVVRFRFTGIDPIQMFDDLHGFHTGRHSAFWDNLMIFERGLGPKECDDASTLGHRIRPFQCKYDPIEGTLIIDIPIVMAVKWDRYGHFKTDTGKLTRIDLCNLDNIIDDIEIFQRQVCQPAGTAMLKPDCTECCGCNGCEVCEMKEIPICLEPVATRSGHFRVIPLINTAIDENGCPDECNPCWEMAGWLQCCDGHYFHRSCLENPIQVCVDYVAGCNECQCYINDRCAPHEISDEPCERFKYAIAALAIALSPMVCECGCLGEFYKRYQKDLREISTQQRFQFRFNDEEFIFGTQQGAVWAWESIRNLRDYRVEYALI